MTPAPDPAAVAAACKDDLGRVRQDELPLSTRLRNGPSFISNYDHYANRYDEPFKDGLLTNWSVAIQDEESEQMSGLVIPDARPWAKDVNLKNMSFGPQSTVFNAVPPKGQKASQPKASNSKAKPSNQRTLRSTAGTNRIIGQNASAPSITGTATESETSAMYVVLEGDCMVEPCQGFGAQPKFKIQVNTVTNMAYLTFINQKKSKEVDYNVLDLSTPELKEKGCHVAKITGDQQGRFRIQLSTNEKAQVFFRILNNIQKSAIQVQDEIKSTSSSSTKPFAQQNAGPAATMPSVATPTRARSTTSFSSTKLPDCKDIKNCMGNVALVKLPPSVSNGSAKPNGSQTKSQPVLVDLNITPPKGPTKPYSVESLAEDLYDFVATMRYRIHHSPISPFTGMYEDVEDIAFTVWGQKDAVHASESPLKRSLSQFLELLSKLDQEPNNNPSVKTAEPLKIDSLIDFDDDDSSTSSVARLQYSAGQIMRMRSHAASFSVEDLSSAPFTKKQRTEIDGPAAIEQYKGWLGNQNQENMAPRQMGFKAVQENKQIVDIKPQVTINKAPAPVPKTVSEEKAVPAPTATATDTKPIVQVKSAIEAPAKPRPKPKGLASSRWAN